MAEGESSGIFDKIKEIATGGIVSKAEKAINLIEKFDDLIELGDKLDKWGKLPPANQLKIQKIYLTRCSKLLDDLQKSAQIDDGFVPETFIKLAYRSKEYLFRDSLQDQRSKVLSIFDKAINILISNPTAYNREFLCEIRATSLNNLVNADKFEKGKEYYQNKIDTIDTNEKGQFEKNGPFSIQNRILKKTLRPEWFYNLIPDIFLFTKPSSKEELSSLIKEMHNSRSIKKSKYIWFLAQALPQQKKGLLPAKISENNCQLFYKFFRDVAYTERGINESMCDAFLFFMSENPPQDYKSKEELAKTNVEKCCQELCNQIDLFTKTVRSHGQLPLELEPQSTAEIIYTKLAEAQIYIYQTYRLNPQIRGNSLAEAMFFNIKRTMINLRNIIAADPSGIADIDGRISGLLNDYGLTALPDIETPNKKSLPKELLLGGKKYKIISRKPINGGMNEVFFLTDYKGQNRYCAKTTTIRDSTPQESLETLKNIKSLEDGAKVIKEIREKASDEIKAMIPQIFETKIIASDNAAAIFAKREFTLEEWCVGKSLDKLLEEIGKIPPDRVLKIAMQLAKYLKHLHTKTGFIHRDLKPGNIILEDHDKIKIIDYQTITIAGKINDLYGTPEYAAPEQYQKTAYPLTDIYQFGVLIYELLTGDQLQDKNTFPKLNILSSEWRNIITNCIRTDTRIIQTGEKLPRRWGSTALVNALSQM